MLKLSNLGEDSFFSISNIWNKDLNTKVLENIQTIMDKKGITRNKLIDSLMKKGYNAKKEINSYFPKGEKAKAQRNLSLSWLIAICSELGVSLDSLLSVDSKIWTNDEFDYMQESEIAKKFFDLMFFDNVNYYYDASKPKHVNAFKNLYEEYYCYFYSTNSLEKFDVIEAKLSILPKNDLYVANLHIGNRVLNNKKPFESEHKLKKKSINKDYTGFLVISETLQCCYCILFGKKIAELNMFVINRFISTSSKMDTSVAELLTVSSGTNKFPTAIRFLLSRSRIEPEILAEIAPYLLMNRSTIDIPVKELNKVIQSNPNWSSLLNECRERRKTTGKDHVYSIKESTIEEVNDVLDENSLTLEELYKLYSTLRANSISEPYNKVNQKVDKAVRLLLHNRGLFPDSDR